MPKAGKAYEELVAYVVSAMDPDAQVEQGVWVEGPDGRRDMDVFVRGEIDGNKLSILIECKDFDPSSTGRVGIEFVDALDSKRHDLSVDFAVICSNSGFTKDAIRKSKRKGISLISVLKSGDPRVKVEIKEEIYTRKVKVGTINITFRGAPSSGIDLEEVKYRGLPVLNWILNRIAIIVAANPSGSTGIRATHTFTQPVTLEFAGNPIDIDGIDFQFPVDTQWLSQVVSLDASLGMYDYIRGRIRLGPGETKYEMKGVNVYEGEPIDFVPDKGDLGVGLLLGELDIDLVLFEGFDMPDRDKIPPLDEYIESEDLEWKVKSS